MACFLNEKGPILGDGAMGTYFALESMGNCEMANLLNPQIISGIHKKYIEAGARLLRTNTFAANTVALGLELPKVLEVVKAGYNIAVSASKGAYVAAVIGPIHADDISNAESEYIAIADAFISEGADIFLFETFSDTQEIKAAVNHIRAAVPEACIITSFVFSPDGETRKGISIERIISGLDGMDIDIFGMNCGIGPAHMTKLVGRAARARLPLWLMPNAGYPVSHNDRMLFSAGPDYFGWLTASMKSEGVAVLGGCCGTTPSHISALAARLEGAGDTKHYMPATVRTETARQVPGEISDKIKAGGAVVVEIDPPFTPDLEPAIDAASALKAAGADAVTIADSPLARVRYDAMMASVAIKRRAGIDVIPHMSCRDRNVNAMRAAVIAGYAEGVRCMLAVTGDPIPESGRGFVKPVFNLNSYGLLSMISGMNDSVFSGAPMLIGGGLNPLASDHDRELKRVEKKLESGAEFFLTQPVYEEKAMRLIQSARRLGAKVLMGVMPVASYRNAQFLVNEVPGINIGGDIISRFNIDMSREESEALGVEIAMGIIKDLGGEADGLYLMIPLGKTHMIVSILDNINKRA
ncbi:MAG: bifunctional homocysteine S-methyltransferase/methylenetetrahydrofolate reductase [Christensenellales bacterium]|jgi:methionine synthase I (cobalamin-dependent)/5,10-methylenetetrahydrofolate reductase